jgi:hypothetical protein
MPPSTRRTIFAFTTSFTWLTACLSRLGAATLALNLIPLIGLVLSFTNTVGAAMWAAELEAKQNILSNTPATDGKTTR